MTIYDQYKPVPGTERKKTSEYTKRRRRENRAAWKRNAKKPNQGVSGIYGKRPRNY